jgi:hypothetical protein
MLITISYDLRKANKQVLSKFISIMTNIINNSDLDKRVQTVANGKKDKQCLRKPVKLRGEWSLDPSKDYQARFIYIKLMSTHNPLHS